MKSFSICDDDSLPTRIKACCDGTSGLSTENEVKMIEHYQKSINNPEPQPASPGLLERAASFVGAIADYAFAGFPAMPEGESERRLSICRACPEFKPETSQCGVCTCYMNIKAHMATAACPLNKWGVATPVENKEGLPPVRDNPSQENEF